MQEKEWQLDDVCLITAGHNSTLFFLYNLKTLKYFIMCTIYFTKLWRTFNRWLSHEVAFFSTKSWYMPSSYSTQQYFYTGLLISINKLHVLLRDLKSVLSFFDCCLHFKSLAPGRRESQLIVTKKKKKIHTKPPEKSNSQVKSHKVKNMTAAKVYVLTKISCTADCDNCMMNNPVGSCSDCFVVP